MVSRSEGREFEPPLLQRFCQISLTINAKNPRNSKQMIASVRFNISAQSVTDYPLEPPILLSIGLIFAKFCEKEWGHAKNCIEKEDGNKMKKD